MFACFHSFGSTFMSVTGIGRMIRPWSEDEKRLISDTDREFKLVGFDGVPASVADELGGKQRAGNSSRKPVGNAARGDAIARTKRELLAHEANVKAFRSEVAVLREEEKAMDMKVRALAKAGNKTGARAELSRLRVHQEEMKKRDAQIRGLERLIAGARGAQLDAQYAQILEASATLIAQATPNPEAVHSIMDNAQLSLNEAAAVSSIISYPMTSSEDIPEYHDPADDVTEAELEEFLLAGDSSASITTEGGPVAVATTEGTSNGGTSSARHLNLRDQAIAGQAIARAPAHVLPYPPPISTIHGTSLSMPPPPDTASMSRRQVVRQQSNQVAT